MNSRCLLEVSVLVLAVGLQDDGDDGHERLDHAELQRGLLAEAQEADGVGLPPQAAGAVHAAGPDGGNDNNVIRFENICDETTPSERRTLQKD